MHASLQGTCSCCGARLQRRSSCGNFPNLLLVLLSCIAVIPTQGRDIRIGGELGWTQAGSFEDLNAVVGDRLVFAWEGDQRNVVTVPKRSCALAPNGVVLAKATDSPHAVELNYTGTFFFTSSLDQQCAEGSLFAVSVTPSDETTEDVQQEHGHHREENFESLIRDGVGHCLDPVEDGALVTRACYSPPMALRPGQVEDAFYVLPNPFPEGVKVGVTKQTLAIVGDSNRQVPLSELYLHHIFGPSNLITGEGAEFRGGHDTPPLPDPYYIVVNGSDFVPDMDRLVNIHVINTLGVAPADVPQCIECWCREEDQRHALKGRHGGGDCCSDSLCPSSEPSSNVNIYHLQFNVTYRVLEPNMTVVPVSSFMMDAVNGSIEYDLVQQADSRTGKVLQSGPMDAQCPQTSSFGLLRCLGHQHIGGQCLRLINQDNGEELCSSCPTYGVSDRAAVGDEDGYLVAMSRAAFSPPKQILPGTNVTIESVYDVSQSHFGVMALFFLDLVDFDTSCPGFASKQADLAFGPDYQHHQGTAFGFYVEGFGAVADGDAELQAEPGDAQGIDVTEDPQDLRPRTTLTSSTAVLPIVFGGALIVGIAAGVVFERWRKARHYQPLKQSDAVTANAASGQSAA